MADLAPAPAFPGFPALRANVTFVPLQFFTVVLPHSSRGCVRLVGYALRRLLGWVDARGEPTHGQARFTYRQLIEEAGVSRDALAEALAEALARRCLECVEPPQPDRAGQPAQSGVYRLCWDVTGAYTDRPEEFRGFYYPEAAVMPVTEQGTAVRRPKAARKNIPNLFFDQLLPRERLSVIRVVGALLFYSIQWGPGGERRVPVQLSITELSRLTRFSRPHVHEALREAQRRGYVVPVAPGCFDPQAGQQSEAATYALRWAAVGNETAFDAGAAGRSAAVPVAPVGERVADRSEKVNGIRIKTEHKTDQTTATTPATPPPAETPPAPRIPVVSDAAAADAAAELLVKTGFEPEFAQRLARKRGLEVIERQLQWLPLRSPQRSRLGLLRRAIEFDWPQPEAAPVAETAEQGLAREFASHYYAAYHGYAGPPTTEVLPRDAQTAGGFLARLLAVRPDRSQVPQWGRRFGEFMRQTHRDDARARPNLAPALLLYGDAFLKSVQPVVPRTGGALEAAREAHERRFTPDYRQYLAGVETRLQREAPALYAAFLEERRRTRHAMAGGLCLASAETLARFDSAAGRLDALAAFGERHRVRGLLTFWQWDAQWNPRRYGTPPPNAAGVSAAADHPAAS